MSQPPFSHADDLHLLGIDPERPFYDLNLAGNSPGNADEPVSSGLQAPDSTVPALADYDLEHAGMMVLPATANDPLQPTQAMYAQPFGLDIQFQSAAELDNELTLHATPQALNVKQGSGWSMSDSHER